MSPLVLRWVFFCTVVVVYLALTVPTLIVIPPDFSARWIAFAILHECIALGIALELSEAGLSLLLRPTRYPKNRDSVSAGVKVAVLYLCCDDVDTASLNALEELSDVDVFILDDSQKEHSRQILEHSGKTLVRRRSRAGFKAGNLNNWIHHYGAYYKYFVVLDSDSIMTTEAVWSLVAYAEHEDNRDVAIVQSSIYPRRGNRFQQLLGSQASARMRVLSRLHNRIGWTLSHGHNNLHRCAAVADVGSFGQYATCEDTILSLQLVRRGWRILLVDTPSHDSEPADAFRYRRRSVRWARQTIDVIRHMGGAVPMRYVALISRHALAYLLPVVCIAMLLLVAATAQLRVSCAWEALWRSLRLEPEHRIPGLIGYSFWIAFCSILALRVISFLREGGTARVFFQSALLSGAIASFSCLHILGGVLKSACRSPAEFQPTGSGGSPRVDLVSIWGGMVWAWAVYVLIAALLVSKPGLLLFGLNFLWAAVLVSAPFGLRWFHRDIEGSTL